MSPADPDAATPLQPPATLPAPGRADLVAPPTEPATPAHPAPEPPPAAHDAEPGGHDRLSLAIAILLATLGVLGAFITWRVGQLGSDAEGASRAALAARRERSSAAIVASTQVMQASAAWLGYEIARRKADALRAAGQPAEAVQWDREAASYWASVPNADIGLDGTYDPGAHTDALMAAATDGIDVAPEGHLNAATAAEHHASRLGQLGFALAGILPILTLAEITQRRRLRVALTVVGAVGVVAGIAALVLAWA